MADRPTSDPNAAPGPAGPATDRVASVDALRGLVITLMIFVNDVAGAPHAPSWLKHVGIDADAMTLPDIVFPAFLFIAGVSIPLAFERSIAGGHSRGQLLVKILGRVFALLVMGVVMVNQEEHNPWARGLWGVLAYVAMFLAFAVVPSKPGRARSILFAARIAGSIALLALAFGYRTPEGRMLVLGPLFDPDDAAWLRHSWWGILGLIGWAYLVSSLVYLVARRRREWLLGAAVLLMALFIAERADVATHVRLRLPDALAWLVDGPALLLGWINSHVGIGTTLGSHASITMAGCCLGAMLSDRTGQASHAERVRWALVFAGGLFVAGVLLDPVHGVNKIRATPSWCLYCSAITAATWAALYWLMDVRGWRGWSRIVQPAGANPLLAYLLHPFLFLLAGLCGSRVAGVVFFYKSSGMPVFVSVIGSLAMAVGVVFVTGRIARAGFRLKV